MTEKEMNRVDDRLRFLIPELPPKASPTRDAAAAMAVFSNILNTHSPTCWRRQSSRNFVIELVNLQCEDESLTLAICKFAIQLLDIETVP